MKYTAPPRDVLSHKDHSRLAVRFLLSVFILLFVPMSTLLQSPDSPARGIATRATWVQWIAFVVGALLILLSAEFVVIRHFVTRTHLPEWDPLIFDRLYGDDIAYWSAAVSYFSAVAWSAKRYGLADTLSDPRIFVVTIISAGVVTGVVATVVSRIVFRTVLFDR